MKTYFFDTSAILKLLLKEPGSKTVRKIIEQFPPPCIFTSWVLVAETMGVLKREWSKKRLSHDNYHQAIYSLLAYIGERRINPIDVIIENGQAILDADARAIIQECKNHPCLDAADALQLALVKNTFLKHFVGSSATCLVTGDENLFKVTQEELKIPAMYVGNDETSMD